MMIVSILGILFKFNILHYYFIILLYFGLYVGMLHISLLVFGIMIWIKCRVNLGTIQVFKIAINVPRFPPYKKN